MSASHHSRVMWVWVGFFVVAGFFLLTEPRAHAFGVLPYALLLACPVLHMLTHGRHTGGGEHTGKHDHGSMPGQGGTQ